MRSGILDENKHLVTMVRRQPPACVDTTSAGVAPPHPAPRAPGRRGPRAPHAWRWRRRSAVAGGRSTT